MRFQASGYKNKLALFQAVIIKSLQYNARILKKSPVIERNARNEVRLIIPCVFSTPSGNYAQASVGIKNIYNEPAFFI